MPLTINFKAIRAIVVVGPLVELNRDLIGQHFTRDVVRLMVDQLPARFSPSEAATVTLANQVAETYGAYYIKDDGELSSSGYY